MNRRNERNWDDRGDRMHRGDYSGDRINDRFQANQRNQDHGPGRNTRAWNEHNAVPQQGVHSDWPVVQRPGYSNDGEGRDRYDPRARQTRQQHDHGGGFLEQGLHDPRSLRGYGDFEAEREPGGAGRSEQAQPQRDFSGRGPKGYRRSDMRLYEDVCERLSEDPQIDAGEISVEVRAGVVILEGSVDQRWVKHHVENIVAHVGGVEDVVNRLEVDRSAGNSRAREMMDGDEGERGDYGTARSRDDNGERGYGTRTRDDDGERRGSQR